MNKTGIYYAYWEQSWSADYVKYVKKVKSLGFDILEIAAGCLPDMPHESLTELKNTALNEGVELTCCIGLPSQYDVSSADEKVRSAGMEFMCKIFDAMNVLDSKLLGGIIYSSWPGTVSSCEEKAHAEKRSADSLKELAKYAKGCGITCCLEIVNRFEQYMMNTAKEGADFLDNVAEDNVKLLLDTFHMNIEEDNIGRAIKTAGSKLGHFHIGECNRKPPGKGHMPWDEIADALRDINYTGAVVMEPFLKPGGEVGRDIRVFRDLSGGADEAEMDNMAKEALEFIKSKLR